MAAEAPTAGLFRFNPLPPEQSLGGLMRDLGFDHFGISDGFPGVPGMVSGGYGEFPLDMMDEEVAAYARHMDDYLRVTRRKTRYGHEAVHPSVIAHGRRYTLVSARFSDEEGFTITTSVRRPFRRTTTEQFTIPQLREELADLIEARKESGFQKVPRMLRALMPGG